MMKEVTGQTNVEVGIERLWNALTKDLKIVIPKAVPNLVKHSEILEGDGGIGTIYLFTFGPDVPNMTYQKEKIVEVDEANHQIGIQVIDGGHLNLGFSSYQTTLQLIEDEPKKTIVNIKVSYEYEVEGNSMESKTISSTIAFISALESYLLIRAF